VREWLEMYEIEKYRRIGCLMELEGEGENKILGATVM